MPEPRPDAVAQLEGHLIRQAAVAELGRRALGTDEFGVVAAEALALALQMLGAELGELLEAVSSRDALRLRGSLGFKAGLVGRAIVDGGERSQAGFVLRRAEPVIIHDLARETRFVPSTLLLDHGARSGIAVSIRTRAGPYGVLGVYSAAPRRFGEDDARFVLALAQLLGLAVDHERSQAELRDREGRYRALIERSTDAILLMDPAGTIIDAAPSIQELLGGGREAFEGRRILTLLHPDDARRVERVLTDLLRAPGTSVTTECRVRHGDGSWRWAECVATNLLHEPAVRAIVGRYRDITERKLAEERIDQQATHDALTGLPNRTLLMDRLRHAIAHASRRRAGLAVLCVDVDGFKRVNDAFGLAAGDTLLGVVGERLRASVREEDTVARVAGDDFVVALGGVERAEDVATIVNKILKLVALPVDVDGRRLRITVSLGISLYPDDGLDAETLLKNADHSLRLAKERGRHA